MMEGEKARWVRGERGVRKGDRRSKRKEIATIVVIWIMKYLQNSITLK